MKKTALVSVHNDPNYGSALQAYALAYAIQREGYDCEYIDYSQFIPSYGFQAKIKAMAKKVFYGLGILEQPKTEYSFWKTPEFQCQRQLFVDFHDEKIPFSEKKYNPLNINEANHEYDCFIVGSDQTWSPLVTKSKNTINFLDFVLKNKKKCSYAPSFGTCHLSEEYLVSLKEKVSSFDHLSCREKHNAKLLSVRLGKEVKFVMDPTLLLSQIEWNEIAEPVEMPDTYILCYILGIKQSIVNFAEVLGKETSLPVYYIVSRPEYLSINNALKNVSPGQFITLISKASYVITDSFHGTMFSINFQRQFYAFTKREGTDSTNDNDRIGDILQVLKLEDRLKNDNDTALLPPIDYNKIKEVLRAQISSSRLYLNTLLSSPKTDD